MRMAWCTTGGARTARIARARCYIWLMQALGSRPLLVFGLVAGFGIAVWAAATVLIKPDPTFVSERPCPESAFSCVTLRVPRDAAAPDDETWEVTFALQRALQGPRQGVIVVITGGPGSSGVAVADLYTEYFAPGVADAYDIVFLDQRGVGRSKPLQCPDASLAWFATPESPTRTAAEASAFTEATSRFVRDCIGETGIDPSDLPFYATRHAVEDLEVFRHWHGVDQLILYGESYGTQYAQVYAAAHPEQVQAILLDGPIDLTRPGLEYYAEVTETAADVLALILDACTDDPACGGDVAGGDALAAYDALAAELRDGPTTFDFVTATGDVEPRTFNLSDLETAADYVLSPSYDRMFLQRAIAQASHGQYQPLARLLYAALAQDPETLAPVPDPSWSDAMYFAVDCSDYAFGTGTPDERAAVYFAAAEAEDLADERLGSGFYLDLPCAFWPAQPDSDERPSYLGDTPYPVFILGSTWDPYTPYPNAERLAENLGNAYLITQPGGPHVIGLRGEPCPDDYLTAYLLDGELPTTRAIECEFIGVDPYVPIPAADVDDYDSTLAALSAVDDELNTSPDWWYWNGVQPLTVGCLFGGHVTYFALETDYEVEIDDCAVSQGLALTGGAVIYEDGSFELSVETAIGSDLTYARDAEGERSATGTLDP